MQNMQQYIYASMQSFYNYLHCVWESIWMKDAGTAHIWERYENIDQIITFENKWPYSLNMLILFEPVQN